MSAQKNGQETDRAAQMASLETQEEARRLGGKVVYVYIDGCADPMVCGGCQSYGNLPNCCSGLELGKCTCGRHLIRIESWECRSTHTNTYIIELPARK